MIGTTLAHNKIIEELGSGGMGTVYAAEDTKLSREIALKVLPEEVASHPERRMRFEREAKAIELYVLGLCTGRRFAGSSRWTRPRMISPGSVGLRT